VGAFTVAGIFLAMEKNFFAAARRQRAAVSVDVLRYWLQPLLAACLVWLWGASAGNMVWGMALGALLSGAVLLLPATRREGLEPAAGTEPPRRLLGEILQYALPLILVIPFLWICNLGDRYIAGKLLGLEAAGMYAAGYGLIAQPFLTSGDAVRQFMRPLYFNAVAAGDVRREMRVLLGWFCLTAGIFVVGLICVIALRDLIARLCLASPYRDAAALMPWIALGVALQGLGRVLENVFMAMRKTYWNLIVQGIGAACCVASVFWLTRTYGIEGTARACPIYFGAILILHLGIGLTMRFRSLSGPRGNGKEEGT
jgi:O-antigen/teichoic acid export membrane protein